MFTAKNPKGKLLDTSERGPRTILVDVGSFLPTSHPREDARVTRRQHHKADARVSFVTGRKNLE